MYDECEEKILFTSSPDTQIHLIFTTGSMFTMGVPKREKKQVVKRDRKIVL